METRGLWISFFTAQYLQAHTYLMRERLVHLSVLRSPRSWAHIALDFIYCYAPHTTLEQVRGSIFQSDELLSFQRGSKMGTKKSIISGVESQTDFNCWSLAFHLILTHCTSYIFIILLDNAQCRVGSYVTHTKHRAILFCIL